jgi:hypothetical protein
MRPTHSLSLFLYGSLAYAECSRESLIAARDKFFSSGAAKSTQLQGIQLAPSTKISFNQKLTPLASTPYSNLTGFNNFIVQAVDSEACQIATFRTSPSQLLSTRLRLDGSGAISEVEFLQAVKGDQFFRPSGIPATTPAIFNQKQTPGRPPNIPASWKAETGTPKGDVNTATCKSGGGQPRALNRKELIYVGSTYCDGLTGKPWDSCVVGGKSCPRNENGVTTTQNCAVGTGVFGFDVKGRRWVADTDTGVVLGVFYFEVARAAGLGTNLFLHEYFKIEAGVLAYIFAPMKNIPRNDAKASLF